MSRGGWHGNRVPETAKTVAKAFYAGRNCKRGNCETDGETYWLEGHIIARRVLAEDVNDEIAKAVLGQKHRKELEFSFAGWPTQMTCRHLRALGVDAEIKRGHLFGPKGGVGEKYDVPCMNSRKVSTHGWHTPDEFNNGPCWEQPRYCQLVAAMQRTVNKCQQAEMEFA